VKFHVFPDRLSGSAFLVRAFTGMVVSTIFEGTGICACRPFSVGGKSMSAWVIAAALLMRRAIIGCWQFLLFVLFDKLFYFIFISAMI
jgi:hypothetical protein